MNILWGIGGLLFLFAVAFMFSTNRKAINWRTILGGLAIQITFAFIVLEWETGRVALKWLSFKVQNVISYANEGTVFLFGGVLTDAENFSFVFAIQVLTVIIFFSSLIAVLYYLGIMQLIIKLLGGALSKLLGTSKAESLSATANIFVGQTEAPLVVRPYINKMTNSELFAVMTGGLASVAGSVLVGYAMLGVPLEYLLAASFMAAPAGLVMAKMLMPETEVPETNKEIKMERDAETVNVVDAAARGASEGLKLAVNVGAMLLAFVALIALINGMLGGIGNWFGFENLSLNLILGYLFAPVAFIIGVPWSEAVIAGGLLGEKLVLNEFFAYLNFAPMIGELSVKTTAIISFALCGFANLSSLAILLGGLGGMAPERRPHIAKFGVRAILAGTLANLLSAVIAGMFIF